MEEMRQIAFETVQRACLFGTLAIFCVMVGMSFQPRLAFQAGGTLTTMMAMILIYKAREALTKDYKKTEMWLYLPKDFRPPEAYAQWASSTVLARYLSHLRAMDLGDRDLHVGDRAVALAVRRERHDLAARYFRLPMNWKITSRLCGLAPVLDQIDALPGAERELALRHRHMQRHAVEHRLDMRRHVVRPFDVMDPGRVFRRQTIERA